MTTKLSLIGRARTRKHLSGWRKKIRCAVPALRSLAILTPLLLYAAGCGSGHKTPVVEGTSGAVKISVIEEGIYELTKADIQAVAPDWDTVNPLQFQLALRGQTQPVWVLDPQGDYRLRFYGQPSDSRYSSENIYWLEINDPPAGEMVEKGMAASSTQPIRSYSATMRLEENHLYAPQVETGDHWFWSMLTAHKSQSFELAATNVQPGTGHLVVEMWASTQAPQQPDHHLLILVNGQAVIDETWDGSGRRTLEAEVPDGIVVQGKNTIEIKAPGDTGAPADITYVDWIELRYSRQAVAEKDSLTFEGASSPLGLTGFSEAVAVFDVTDPERVFRISNIQPVGEELVVQTEAGHRYLAVGSKGYRHPESLAPASLSPDLHLPASGADYVAVGAEDLLQPLQPLLDWRNSQGLQTMAVPLQAIYDQFNDGFPEPEAIRSFMEYVASSWQPAPRYLLLVGDATYDPLGYANPAAEANRLPVFFIQTDYGGETASDVLFGDLDGDQLPDLSVGRIPAQTPAQVRQWVEKTLSYEQNIPAGDWQHQILAIADGQESTFGDDAQTFLDLFPSSFAGATLYAPPVGVSDAPARIQRYFNDGFLLVGYFGHGSINMWGKDRLFMTEDVEGLSNSQHVPVVVNMTCLTGFFIHPKLTSLSEALLWKQPGGAVAVLAPTSLTLPDSQSVLSSAFVVELVKDPAIPLGQIFLAAQRRVPVENSATREVLLTFLYFGDPALRLAYAAP